MAAAQPIAAQVVHDAILLIMIIPMAMIIVMRVGGTKNIPLIMSNDWRFFLHILIL